jgi:hypothetical protein
MIYFIPSHGYISDSQQFTLNGITYPGNWLRSITEDMRSAIGAIPRPPAGPDQVVDKTDDGWVVRDLTPEELMARENAAAASSVAAVADAIDTLWKRSWDEWGEQQLAAVDRTTIGIWAAGGVLDAQGMNMFREIITWHDTVFMGPYTQAKAAIEAAGAWVEPDWDAWPKCPYSFNQFFARRIA